MKILIIDDSKFSQKVTFNLINKFLNDPEIYLANDGEEGFEKYKEIEPDFVLLDLLMPKLNGEELIKLIEEYNRNAKIIVISADVQKSVKDEIKKHDVMAFINKPFNEEKARFVCDMIRNDKNEE